VLSQTGPRLKLNINKERFFATAFFILFIALFHELIHVKDNHDGFNFISVAADVVISIVLGFIIALIR
jgi:hypothetical protein